jgi:hypothetical protein
MSEPMKCIMHCYKCDEYMGELPKGDPQSSELEFICHRCYYVYDLCGRASHE